MRQVIEATGPCKARDTETPHADREFVIASVRTARTRLQLMAYEMDEIGVALKHDMLTLEQAVLWLREVDVLAIVNRDVWCEAPAPVAA